MPVELGRLYSIAYTGLNARQTELNTVANNLANLNSTAYEEQRVTFQAALGQTQTVERLGVVMGSAGPCFSQGPIETTGQTWNLAIDGAGFFQVGLPNGVTGYTRSGLFHIDSNGHLVSQEGFLVNPPITVPAETSNASVDANGNVTATVNGQPELLGQLQLASFPNPDGLLEQGNGIYLPSADSGAAVTGVPNANGMGQILGGALEESNVNASEQMINLLRTQRAYSLTLHGLQISDQMASIAIR